LRLDTVVLVGLGCLFAGFRRGGEGARVGGASVTRGARGWLGTVDRAAIGGGETGKRGGTGLDNPLAVGACCEGVATADVLVVGRTGVASLDTLATA
jgi:hypothetical protein